MKMSFPILVRKAKITGVALVSIIIVSISCDSGNNGKNLMLFGKLSSRVTGIAFENTLTESDTLNYFLYPYIYMGGGVSVGDFNNDGLTDIYLVGNMVPDRLYLNRGNFTFEDVTEISNTGGGNRWKQGSTICDINNDGLTDIYVCVSGLSGNRENLLYINQGIDKDGIPVFKEEAVKYGINDPGMSTQAVFFDYDNDGDLDLYVGNYPITSFKATPYVYKQIMRNVKWLESGHLYRNDGDSSFAEITRESGLLAFGLTLSATVADFNQDGFKDLYISNDFTCPDYFYFNNGDGTFSDKAGEVLGQTSFYGMGADVADYNNDGLPDIMQIDMAPEDNKRAKVNMSEIPPEEFDEMVREGLHYQYRYSTLNLNRGNIKNDLPYFTNAAWIAGVTSTDWSWAALFADFDLDGWKDLYITNGSRRDMNNADYFNKIGQSDYFNKSSDKRELLENSLNMPSKPMVNYIYRNNGDLTFTPYNKQWNIREPSYSNGVAYADLDNDGDLDLIVNNIDQEALIYKNNASETKSGNWLKVKFDGPQRNRMGIGSVVTIWSNGKTQTSELTLTRGYLSSVEPILYFGVAKDPVIDSLKVQWGDGKVQVLTNIPSNQCLNLHPEDAKPVQKKIEIKDQIFKEITDSVKFGFSHKENFFDDYRNQVLLPYRLSQLGPAIATGDVNDDKLDDFFIGNASGSSGKMFIQNTDGTFRDQDGPWRQDSIYEDAGCLFFDADNDGDPDLFVASGGNEFPDGSENYTSRLYINNGDGNFTRSREALPQVTTSGSCVKAFDFDNDGDLDLFIGGRQVPGKYPFPARSYLLENKSINGVAKFTDITKEAAPDLLNAGMVTSAFCGDLDNDQWTDLVVAGEWMPVCIYKNDHGKFKRSAIEGTKGWWFTISGADIDKDGDVDLTAGNLGLNFRYKASREKTFDIYAADFDKDGKSDIVLSYYQGNKQFPLRGRESFVRQNPAIASKFLTFGGFGEATVSDIYTRKALGESLHLQAETFASSWFENDGKGNFRMHNFPNEAQLSSINGMIIDDFNKDGNPDILAAGNLYNVEIVTPRNDGSVGVYMEGDGKGGFKIIPPCETGFFAPGDVRSLAMIELKTGDKLVLVGNNNGKLQIFKIK
jgi:hypothetical protein